MYVQMIAIYCTAIENLRGLQRRQCETPCRSPVEICTHPQPVVYS